MNVERNELGLNGINWSSLHTTAPESIYSSDIMVSCGASSWAGIVAIIRLNINFEILESYAISIYS